jgi:predicted tellurium resistance membrane protein TerC
MIELLSSPEAWFSLLTLCALEIVLGIDNVIFISILTSKLPLHQQRTARNIGLSFALFMRIALLLSLSWIMGLTEPLFSINEHGVAGRDLILFFGGLFLIYKSVKEIHAKFEESDEPGGAPAKQLAGIIVQIMLIDLVFSLDSIITAVGMVDEVAIMIAAVIISVFMMILSAGAISRFVHKHPAIKVLALSFLISIGIALVAEGLHFKIPKGYIYYSMAFALAVEVVNIRLSTRPRPEGTADQK